jgi:hypothetical protein
MKKGLLTVVSSLPEIWKGMFVPAGEKLESAAVRKCGSVAPLRGTRALKRESGGLGVRNEGSEGTGSLIVDA